MAFGERLLWVILAWSSLSFVAMADDAPVDYLTQIKPLLTKRCAECHGADDQQSSLRVDAAKALLSGGDTGPAIVPGKSAESLLIQAVTGSNSVTRMPPEGDPLTAAEIDLLRRWIDAGAVAPADEQFVPAKSRSSDHWAFQPIRASVPPVHSEGAVAHHAIDAFIQARLAKEGIRPSPPADKTTLLRRAHLDLLGLPPSSELVAEFLADDAPDAYDRLIDRLLASAHYGERWGRDWLDAARYADSNGFTRDMPRTIWRYRDWVIDAFNANLPFDEFTIQQLAGDLLPEATLDQLVATGFHRNTLINEEGGTDPEQFRVEAVVDRVNTTGAVYLGLTVGCAQCHEHKYDPLSQREYYQLFAIFNSVEFTSSDPAAPRIDVPTAEQVRAGELERRTEIRRQIAECEQSLKDQQDAIQTAQDAWEKTLTEDDKKKLPFQVKNALDLPVSDRSDVHKRDLANHFKATETARQQFPQLDQIAQLKASEPQFVSTMIVRELPQPRETSIMIRGDFLRTGAKVEPAVPAVLPPLTKSGERANRLDFARWLVSPEHPLTARVAVNRVWQRLFGRGIVETENDFGAQGDLPTHPELLDWLAAEFQRTGWDLKRLHRLIVTSATYRQSSAARPDLANIDAANKLLARQSRLRLDAELIRDAALQASGLLADQLGGPPVTPPQPDGVFDFTQDKKPWKAATDGDRYRRGLYTQLWRSSLYPAMTVFDFPDANVTCTRRNRSNTPLQSLTLANDETFVEFARGLAATLLQFPVDDTTRLQWAVQRTLGRDPTSLERETLSRFLNEQRLVFAANTGSAHGWAADVAAPDVPRPEAAAWVAVSRVLMNLDEFITRE